MSAAYDESRAEMMRSVRRRRMATSLLAAMVGADVAGNRPHQVAEAVALADMLETRLQTFSPRSSDPVARLVRAAKRWRDTVASEKHDARNDDAACTALARAVDEVLP